MARKRYAVKGCLWNLTGRSKIFERKDEITLGSVMNGGIGSKSLLLDAFAAIARLSSYGRIPGQLIQQLQ